MGLRARMETARVFVAFAVLLMTDSPLPACTIANRDAHPSIFPIPIFPGSLLPARQSADSPQSSANTAQDIGESSSKHSGHHIRVPVEDDNAEPAELTEAEEAIDRNNYPDAETILRKFVERQPANYVAWFDLGFVENALGKLTDSIAAYRKSVEAKPDVFESNLNLGLQLAKNGHSDAEKFLRQATQLTPTSHLEEGKYRAWIALGQTVEKAKPDEALDAYHNAATFQPNRTEPHLSRGEIFEREDKFSDAEMEYKRALALDPHSSDALTALANLYLRGRRFPQAEEYLRQLVAQQPDSAAAHIQLGRVLAAEGKNDAAIGEMQTGLKLTPGDDNAQRDLADLYSAAGKNELAETSYRQLLTSHPNDAELHRRLGETLLALKKFPDAQQEFAEAIRLKPDFGQAYSGLAFAAGENKDYALAIKALNARAKFLPEVPITYFMRASAYDHLRDYKQAATNYHLFLNSAQGKYPDQEWQAKHRLIAIEPKH
jgi:tetratricopeptide (TPR) repeat protein